MSTPIATVVIVDDDEGVRESLRELLRAADYNALTFASAEEYLTRAEGAGIDCMIVDVNLPGMNGVALVQTLSRRGDTTPVVLITARDDTATLNVTRRVAETPLLRKPFTDDALFDAIGRVMHNE